MNDLEEMLKDSATRLFSALATRELHDHAENGAWPADAWQAIQEAGLACALDPTADDAQLLPLELLAVIARASGQHPLPLPVGETLFAQWLLHRAGLAFPAGPLSLAPAEAPLPTLHRTAIGWVIDGHVPQVPWGRSARAIAVQARHGSHVVLVRLEGVAPCSLETNLAGEPRDSFFLERHPLADDSVRFPADGSVPAPRQAGALLRALQIAGALEQVLDMTVCYSLERSQFGRPIAKFQAIQQQVAVMAGQAAASSAAAAAAVHYAAGGEADFAIAAAKQRGSEAAGIGAEIAHQVHGAIGFTHEHPLHLHTRRLLSWRDEFGSDREWSRSIGKHILGLGGDQLWRHLHHTGTSEPVASHEVETRHA